MDAAAVELGEGEDVTDRLIAETEAAAFLFGQTLGEDCGVEGSEREAAIGAALEPQIVVALTFEALEDGTGRRAFIGLEEGDELGGEAECQGNVNKIVGGRTGG
jgi:hypothetical protein